MKTKVTHSQSLRTFITLTVASIVTIILLCSILFYYHKSSTILKENSQATITNQLNQVNMQIMEQVNSIDSVIPLFLSNNMILEALEEPFSEAASENMRFQIERQMSYIYTSTPLSSKNFVNSIYVISDTQNIYHTYTSADTEDISAEAKDLPRYFDVSQPSLMCSPLEGHANLIAFARNLYSTATGRHMGLMILNIDAKKFMDYCSNSLDPSWSILLFNEKISVTSPAEDVLIEKITAQKPLLSFQEITSEQRTYFVAAKALGELGLTSVVTAPKDLLLNDLNTTLKSYLIFMAVTILIALAAAIIISRSITRPIEKMIYQINQISLGNQTEIPQMKLYREFNVWADAFNQMLEKLNASYNENFQKQLLLKNAKIQSLQAQMDPHFLFNVLNTIAWKAQMIDNEEIYQMVISLGELLKMNTLAKSRAFVRLEQEMEYVKFYIYLQQMRFEDKISCSIQIPAELMKCEIPCFCIQPLVENAIVHGLEPKRGKGKLAIQIIKKEPDQMEICIVDNGVGFETIPDIQKIAFSDEDTHTHIGLRNLDKRLELIFGETARLKITSVPNECTSISFTIPMKNQD